MGRPRKHNLELPPCVYLRHGKFYLVKRGKWTLIGGEAELEAYKRQSSTDQGTMVWLIREGLKAILSKPNLSSNTKAQYRVAARKLEFSFAEFRPDEVRGKHILALKRGMADRPNMFNRCLSLLRQIFDYGMGEEFVDDNPARGVTQHKEAKRERLLSPEEFDRIYHHASPRLQAMMDIWRASGQRVMDVVRIHRRDLLPEGIAFRQQKTGARLIVRWTPELTEAVERAKSLSTAVSLFTPKRGRNRGSAPSYGAIRDEWRRVCEAAKVEDAQMRDLRAVAGTEAEAQGLNATALLGHTSPAMTRRYLRAKTVPVVEAPVFTMKAYAKTKKT